MDKIKFSVHVTQLQNGYFKYYISKTEIIDGKKIYQVLQTDGSYSVISWTKFTAHFDTREEVNAQVIRQEKIYIMNKACE